jgi:hypothetical protein
MDSYERELRAGIERERREREARRRREAHQTPSAARQFEAGTVAARIYRILEATQHPDINPEKKKRHEARLAGFSVTELTEALSAMEIGSRGGEEEKRGRFRTLLRRAIEVRRRDSKVPSAPSFTESSSLPRRWRRATPDPPTPASSRRRMSSDEAEDDHEYHPAQEEEATSDDDAMSVGSGTTAASSPPPAAEQSPPPGTPPASSPPGTPPPSSSRRAESPPPADTPPRPGPGPQARGPPTAGPKRRKPCQACKVFDCNPLKKACPFHHSKLASIRLRADALQKEVERLQRQVEVLQQSGSAEAIRRARTAVREAERILDTELHHRRR